MAASNATPIDTSLTDMTRQVRRPPVERRELARLLGELGHVGSNLNQIARTLNCGGGVALPVLQESLCGFGVLRAAILTALGRDT